MKVMSTGHQQVSPYLLPSKDVRLAQALSPSPVLIPATQYPPREVNAQRVTRANGVARRSTVLMPAVPQASIAQRHATQGMFRPWSLVRSEEMEKSL